MNSPSCQTTSQMRGVATSFVLSPFENIELLLLKQIRTNGREGISGHVLQECAAAILQEPAPLPERSAPRLRTMIGTSHDNVRPLCLARNHRCRDMRSVPAREAIVQSPMSNVPMSNVQCPDRK